MHNSCCKACRILIVDDCRTFHNELRDILESGSDGCEIISAYHGQEASGAIGAAAAADCRFDLAFVAVRTPTGWDRIETVRQLQVIDEGLQTVICGRLSDVDWQDIARRLGHNANTFLLRTPLNKLDVWQLATILTEKQNCLKATTLQQVSSKRIIEQLHADLRDKESTPCPTQQINFTVRPCRPIEPAPIVVGELIERLAQSIQRNNGCRSPAIVGATIARGSIAIDRNEIYEALRSLCRSALDATLHGGVISIDARAVDAKNSTRDTFARRFCSPPVQRYVAIRISDAGCSIPINVRDRLFESCLTRRTIVEESEPVQLTVHEIVKQHGGWIEVESNYAVGTTVIVNLPLNDEATPAPFSLRMVDRAKNGPNGRDCDLPRLMYDVNR